MLQVIIFCCIFPDLGKSLSLEAEAYLDRVYPDWDYPEYPDWEHKDTQIEVT